MFTVLPDGRTCPARQFAHPFHKLAADHHLTCHGVAQVRREGAAFDDGDAERLVVIVAHEVHIGDVHILLSRLRVIYIVSAAMFGRQLIPPRHARHFGQLFQFLHATLLFGLCDAGKWYVKHILVFEARVVMGQRTVLQADDRQYRHEERGEEELHEEQPQLPVAFALGIAAVGVGDGNACVQVAGHYAAEEDDEGSHPPHIRLS